MHEIYAKTDLVLIFLYSIIFALNKFNKLNTEKNTAKPIPVRTHSMGKKCKSSLSCDVIFFLCRFNSILL